MKPIGKYLVVEMINEEITTQSGLVLSGEDVNSLRYRKGAVIESGTDVADINKDDKIYFDKANSFTMLINDIQYTIIQERDVVVVL